MMLEIDEQDQQELLLLVKVARFETIHRSWGDTQRGVALVDLQNRIEAAK